MTLLMMGSVELLSTPEKSTAFIEDMSSSELSKAVSVNFLSHFVFLHCNVL